MCSYKSFDDLPIVLTSMDIAAVLGVSKNNAYSIIHSEGFPVVRVGKQYRVLRSRFIEWLDAKAYAA